MKKIVIKLNDGNEIVGEVMDEDDLTMTCVDENGLVFEVDTWEED